jgi:hypothetical protein
MMNDELEIMWKNVEGYGRGQFLRYNIRIQSDFLVAEMSGCTATFNLLIL